MHSVPLHRSIIAIDIERTNSPAHTNPIRDELRLEACRPLDTAMRTAGVTYERCDPLTDRGDGVLALIHPGDRLPKTLLPNSLIPVLQPLADRNDNLASAERHRRELRLRAVIHAGEVHCDANGYLGEALDLAFHSMVGCISRFLSLPSAGARRPSTRESVVAAGEYILPAEPNHRPCSVSTLITVRTHGDEGARLSSLESEVQVSIISDTSAAPHKTGEHTLYVMRDAADPDGDKLYFTEAEWDAFVKGVKDGEFDLDESGNLPQDVIERRAHEIQIP